MSFPRYPHYHPSVVSWFAELPTTWVVKALKRVAYLQSGEAITAENIKSEGLYPVYGGNGLRGYTDARTHSGHFALIGRQGALCGNINYAKGDFWASEHAVVVTPKTNAEPLWLGELLRSMNLGQYSMSAAQPGLSVEVIGNLSIPVPPPADQRAIATFLDRETAKIDDLVVEQERLIRLLEEKRQAVITHAVTNGLDPRAPTRDSGVAWFGATPTKWSIRKLTGIARLETGHTPSRLHPEYWIADHCIFPWFTLADVSVLRSGRKIYVSDTSELVSQVGIDNSAARLLPKGTVILSRTASVGFSGITSVVMAVSQDFAAWICGPSLHEKYLLYCLRSMKGEFRRLMYGSTHKTIYMPDIEAIRIPVPPYEQQEAIVEHVDRELEILNALADEASRAVALLQERRAALISAAVTGKIDVRGLAAADPAMQEAAE